MCRGLDNVNITNGRFQLRQAWWVGLLLMILALALLPLFVRSSYILHLVILFLMWLALGESWNILGGFTGQISFGHAAFFGIGAYVTSLLFVKAGVPLWLGGLFGSLIAVVISVPIGIVCFRLRGPYFALTVLGVSEIFRLIATNWRAVTSGPVGILFPPVFNSKVPFYYIVLLLAVLSVSLAWLTLRSKPGYYFRAIREDQSAASALGINTTLFKLLALMESAFLTGLVGGFFAPYQGYIDPDIVFSSADISIAMIVVTVLGGIGTVFGPAVGAVIVVALSEVFRSTLGEAHFLVYAALIICIVLFLPEGILGRLERLFSRGGISATDELSSTPTSQARLLNRVIEVQDTRPVATSNPNSITPILQTEKVTKKFGGLMALVEVDLKVKQGEILGLIGPNGAGKTTLLSIISGFEKPTSGKVVFHSQDITGMLPHKLTHQGIARTFQIVRPLSRMTVRENVLTAALSTTSSIRSAQEKAMEVLNFTELYGRREVMAASLTLAERKRLELSRALATSPKLLLLDEVAAGLNSAEIKRMVHILERIRETGITIVAVEHVMEVIMSIADRVVVLHYGQVLAEGRPDEVVKNPEVIEAYLGGSEVASGA